MLQRMRAVNKLVLLGLLATALPTAGSAGATGAPPTPRQVTAAVARATRSQLLWATINTCNDRGDGTVGIRGQMPALSFPAHLLMTVTVEEWSPTAHRYVPLHRSWKLGGQRFGRGSVVQEGLRLRFGTPVTVIARIDFQWFADGRLIGSTTRSTTAGHPDAKGLPAGYSVGTCTLS
jgi:hypothetical protein